MRKEGHIYYIILNSKMNMIDYSFLEKFHEYLDIIENTEGPCMLVTINRGTYNFCSGYNLMTMMERTHNFTLLPLTGLKLFGRLLNLNVPTLAIANGHAVAGGMFLGLCHDKFVICDKPILKYYLSESLINMSLAFLYADLLKELVPDRAARELLSGKKMNP